jgi:hypothetical protein
MASKSLKRFRGRLIFAYFFGCGGGAFFAGGFANFGVQNVVFGWSNCGGFVVKTWTKFAAN